jgi:glycolate oxidase FAD binding subunit
LAAFGGAEILDTAASLALWRDVRDCRPLPAGAATWRVTVAPSAAPKILAAAEMAGLAGILDWGGGLIWLSGEATEAAHQAVTGAARAHGGVWWLMNAPDPLRAAVDVVPAEAPALAKISARVRQMFDPRGIFNPGKMRAA